MYPSNPGLIKCQVQQLPPSRLVEAAHTLPKDSHDTLGHPLHVRPFYMYELLAKTFLYTAIV